MNRWNEPDAAGLDDFGLLLYTSHLLGEDPSLVVWGGGNTSLKRRERDFRGHEVETLWIKASGFDLKTISREGFVALRLEPLRELLSRERLSDGEMLEWLQHCLLDAAAPRPSVETLLHAFLPYHYVSHTHPDAIIALTTLPDGETCVSQALGGGAVAIPYIHPGLAVALQAHRALEGQPEARGIVLERHGLVTFGETAREAYESTADLVRQAEGYIARRRRSVASTPATSLEDGTLPVGRGLADRRGRRGTSPRPTDARSVHAMILAALRGALCPQRNGVVVLDSDRRVLELLASPEVVARTQLGPATPDHLIRTKLRPLVLQLGDSSDVERISHDARAGVEAYVREYEAYFRRHAGEGVAMLAPYPRIVLLPDLGMAATGRDRHEAIVARDTYRRTLEVIDHSLALGPYQPPSEQELFEMEYWPLQLHKLGLNASPAQEGLLAGRVALVTGAASGIGRAVARRLAGEGAHVAVADVDAAGARAVAAEIEATVGGNTPLAVPMDVTSETAVRRGIEAALLQYGGLDIVVSNAGLLHSARVRELRLEDWERSFAINARGHFLVAREALRALHLQGPGGCFVFVASKNVFGPGAEFGAYSAAKAAEAQLAKVLALEEGPNGIRVNIVSPDAVFTGSRAWSEEVRRSRAAAHGIAPEELESFYAARNLLRVRILPEDVAEAVLFLASDRSAKITGCTITVDGGVREAFPR